MSPPQPNQAPAAGSPAPHRTSVLLVLGCTFLGAAAQILMKMGGNALPPGASALQMLTCPPLFAGLAVYGLSTVLLILALRKSELSLMYPIIALTYVWVMILSVLIFHESLNPPKILGVLVIVAGVAVLGRGSQGQSQSQTQPPPGSPR